MADIEARLAAALNDACEGEPVAWSARQEGVSLRPVGIAREMLLADPTLAADLALAAAVRDIEAEFHPLRAIAATSGPDGWEMTVGGYDLAGTIVYRSGKEQTLGEAFAAIIQAAKEVIELDDT